MFAPCSPFMSSCNPIILFCEFDNGTYNHEKKYTLYLNVWNIIRISRVYYENKIFRVFRQARLDRSIYWYLKCFNYVFKDYIVLVKTRCP